MDIKLSVSVYMQCLHKLLDADRPSTRPGPQAHRAFQYEKSRRALVLEKYYPSRDSVFWKRTATWRRPRSQRATLLSLRAINNLQSQRFMTSWWMPLWLSTVKSLPRIAVYFCSMAQLCCTRCNMGQKVQCSGQEQHFSGLYMLQVHFKTKKLTHSM